MAQNRKISVPCQRPEIERHNFFKPNPQLDLGDWILMIVTSLNASPTLMLRTKITKIITNDISSPTSVANIDVKPIEFWVLLIRNLSRTYIMYHIHHTSYIIWFIWYSLSDEEISFDGLNCNNSSFGFHFLRFLTFRQKFCHKTPVWWLVGL